MFGLLINTVIGVGIVALGVAAYKLWKANKAVTGASVISEAETVVADSATAATPAVGAIVSSAVDKVVSDVVEKV